MALLAVSGAAELIRLIRGTTTRFIERYLAECARRFERRGVGPDRRSGPGVLGRWPDGTPFEARPPGSGERHLVRGGHRGPVAGPASVLPELEHGPPLPPALVARRDLGSDRGPPPDPGPPARRP